jgi:hypothetical protein
MVLKKARHLSEALLANLCQGGKPLKNNEGILVKEAKD